MQIDEIEMNYEILMNKYEALREEYDKLRDENKQATRELENLKEEKSSIMTTMPLFAALVGGFFGGKQALIEGESYWGCIIPGIAFATFGTGFAFLVFFALQQLAPATRRRENAWVELFWKALVFGGLFLIGAFLSYKLHW